MKMLLNSQCRLKQISCIKAGQYVAEDEVAKVEGPLAERAGGSMR